jgi:N-acetylmuramoyl-L-alanine amidase
MGHRIICLDAGHGGSQPGAVYGDLLEKDITLKVSTEAGSILHMHGHDVIYTRTEDVTVSLEERCRTSNLNHASIFVSIHCNADPDEDAPGMPEAKGEEIWIHTGSVNGMEIAKHLKSWIDQIFPDEPFRGIKESSGLYVLKHTLAPAVLIEIGFIDKSSSGETFTDPATLSKIANLIANGIMEAL